MPSVRHLRILAVSRPAVNAADLGLSLRTEAGDQIHLKFSRCLAREIAASIYETTGPAPAPTLKGGPSSRRGRWNEISPEVLAKVDAFFPDWLARRVTQAVVAAQTGVSGNTVCKRFTLLLQRQEAQARAIAAPAEPAREPVLKPGGEIL